MEFREVIIAVADETRYTRKEIRRILRVLARVTQEELAAGRDVQLRGIGKFKNVQGKARKGRNKFTGAPIDIPPMRRLKYRPSDQIIDALIKSESVFKEEGLEKRFGLEPARPVENRTRTILRGRRVHGKVRSGDRPEQGTEGKEGGRGG